MSSETERTECAQKNGKIDENSNEDKERIDPIYLEKSATQELNEFDKVLSIVDNINIDDEESDYDDSIENGSIHNGKKDVIHVNNIGGANDDDTNDIIMIDNTEPTDIDSIENKRSTLNADATMMDLPDDKYAKNETDHSSERCCSRLCKTYFFYNRQGNSVTSGFILMLITGFHVMWALHYLNRNDKQPRMPSIAIIIYYFGAIVGSITGALLITIIRKKFIYDIGAIAALLSSLLLILSNSNDICLIFGRIFGGIVHGLVYITTIIHSAENASKNFRHLLLLIFGYNFGVSLLMAALLRLPPYSGANPENMVAIPSIIFAIIAILCTRFLVKESPLYLLQQQRVVYEEDLSEAYDTFTSLQKRLLTPDEIQKKFDEVKLHFADEMSNSQNIFTDGNFKPFLLCLCSRLVGVLSLNLPLVMEVLSCDVLRDFEHHMHKITITIILWFIGGMAMICSFHRCNRKHWFYVVSMLFGMIITFIGILLIFGVKSYIFKDVFRQLILCVYFFLVSLPLEMISTLYLSEAFILPKKPISIVIITILEHLLHILLIFLYLQKHNDAFWIITSLGLIGLSIKVYWSLPRTTNVMTLHQSANAFKNSTVMEWYSQANINSRCVV